MSTRLRWGLLRGLARIWRVVPVRGVGKLIECGWLRDPTRMGESVLRIYGARVLVALDNPPELSLVLWREYEPEVEAALRAILGPGDAAIDVGANSGVLTVLMRSRVGDQGRIIAVDPSPRACLRVRQQARLNSFENVEVAQLALDDQVSTEHYAPARVGIGMLPSRETELVVGPVRPVETTTLDELVRSTGLSCVDLIKIDTDGGEAAILRGALPTLQKLRPVLVFELSAAGLQRHGETTASLADALDRAGYVSYEPILTSSQFSARPGRPEGLRQVRSSEIVSGALGDGNLIALPAEGPKELYERLVRAFT
jgi:FkbM family methyltransferase